ncbi:hypothetical protein ACSMFR_01700 [Listeria aquatica]|uniref:Uncharacterized protein n=1 Tax=Listeria aquatica TaxID=1494960 RepID=A0A841ZQU4_9LIST|nr:hypothetical protein [Listeria aquatica]MBC1521792.1 hypothetical protein [Listeria aquatica]
MYRKWERFYKSYPIWSVLIVAIVASIVGITIEFIINGDFIGSAIYAVIFITVIQIIIVLNKKRKRK